MIHLTVQALHAMTGADLLDLLSQQRQRHNGDLQIGSTVWRVYRSTNRGRGEPCLHLWREVDDEGNTPMSVHVQGAVTQRIVEMQRVER